MLSSENGMIEVSEPVSGNALILIPILLKLSTCVYTVLLKQIILAVSAVTSG